MNIMTTPTKGFSGKVVLVTGASSGIGRAAAQIFGREGAHVIATSRSESGNAETVRLIKEAGGEASFIVADMAKPAEIADLFAEIGKRFGRLDAAFNNAGVPHPPGPITEISEADFDNVINVNLKSVFLCMQHEIRMMLQKGQGAIVNMSSEGGLVGTRGISVYCASKHGVIGLTRSAAIEFAAKNIRINAVCPSVIRNTAIIEQIAKTNPEVVAYLESTHPIGRAGQPSEVGEAVMWLCSDAASFVTGQALAVDGGVYAGR